MTGKLLLATTRAICIMLIRALAFAICKFAKWTSSLTLGMFDCAALVHVKLRGSAATAEAFIVHLGVPICRRGSLLGLEVVGS
jgi:hypothetical protein